MPTRPDLRELAAHVKESFAEMDRETLLDILTFVVKEYVVEGPPPMLVHQAETIADLQGLSFAQLIQALQTRFEHPELSMFAVDGDQVSVRVGGVMQPLVAARQPLTAPAAAELPRPQAGVRVVEAGLQQQRPAPAPAPAQPAAAPPPPRGLSIRGRPQGEPGAVPPPGTPQAQPQPPAQGQAPAQGAAQPGAPEPKDKPEGSGDDASARFSLLELD